MCSIVPRLGILLIGGSLLAVVSPAQAWVESSVESQVVTVELDRQGKAQVTQELLVNVRGGPLESYTLEGVDSDAEPLADSRVLDTHSDDTAGIPISATRLPNGSLKLSLEEGRGLSRGSYLFRFAYRTDLLGRGLLRAQVGHAELNWNGPRLADGVDSAKAIFRFPRAVVPPSLPSQDLERTALGLDPELAGVFISNLVRGQRYDEVEVVRLHIAAREAPTYKLWAGLDAFNEFAPVPAQTVVNSALPSRSERWKAPLSIAIGLLGMGLSLFRFKRSQGAAAALNARLTPLIPGPNLLRIPLIGVLVGVSAACALFTQIPWLALVGTLAASALLLHDISATSPPLRGPGEWKPLTVKELSALSRASANVETGSFGSTRASLANFGSTGAGSTSTGSASASGAEPASTGSGLVPSRFGLSRLSTAFKLRLGFTLLLLSTVAAITFLPFGMSERVTFGLVWLCFLLALGSSGRREHAQVAAFGRTVTEMLKYRNALAKSRGVEVRVLGRFGAGSTVPDEVRLRVLPCRAKSGLLGVELGTIFGRGGMLQPYVLVRVMDGSLACRALPSRMVWVRGRNAEERVAVVAPRVPMRSATRQLILELVELTRESEVAELKPSQKATSSGGNSARASKAKMRVSPPKAA